MKALKVSCTLAILAGVLCASGARAQSYGNDQQVRAIGAAEFQSESGTDAYVGSDGYLYQTANGDHYRAPLSLPDGALVEEICLYANDSDSDPGGYVEASLIAVKLVPGGESPAFQTEGALAFSMSNVGYGRYCTEFAHTLRGRIDVDNDGMLDNVAYDVLAKVPLATQNSLGLGGVRIIWRRQVSPPETVTFGDVPQSDPGFEYIEALVASGITVGCNTMPPIYCPDATLTRRHMAVFLAKALGLHWVE
jgi:hypothetical protein